MIRCWIEINKKYFSVIPFVFAKNTLEIKSTTLMVCHIRSLVCTMSFFFHNFLIALEYIARHKKHIHVLKTKHGHFLEHGEIKGRLASMGRSYTGLVCAPSAEAGPLQSNYWHSSDMLTEKETILDLISINFSLKSNFARSTLCSSRLKYFSYLFIPFCKMRPVNTSVWPVNRPFTAGPIESAPHSAEQTSQ